MFDKMFDKIVGAISSLVHRQRSMSMDEVNESLTFCNEHKVMSGGENLAWQTSVVDLLKLLDLDSGFQARRALAEELGFTATFIGTAEQNHELHKLVMADVAKRCTKIPEA